MMRKAILLAGLLMVLMLLCGLPAFAAYEDGVECDYCGSWRYDDWKCDNGDHCGEGSGTSCYEEHHCGYCGACDDDHELCDDCGNCLEDHCECDDKCRGCYEMSGTVCSECGEKCSECAEWICDECEKCPDCVGNEAYCSYCDVCINCAEWICYCGDGCGRCTVGCEQCYEKCLNCAEDEMCKECGTCFDCLGGEGNYCADCLLCKFCTDYICECGRGCVECVLICEQCQEKCEECADGGICKDCGTCYDCVGGEGNYCINCDLCKFCVDQVCVGCGEGCSECAILCPECNAVCENCGDDQLCGSCEVCFECVGGEGNYCEECGECKNCVELCACGQGCVQCTEVCPECREKCMRCADDQICAECGICFDCVGGEGNYCADCGLCKRCVEICACGQGCVDCATVCPECGEKCTNCAEEEICGGCNTCKDCVGGEGNFCDNCEICKFCAESVCICGMGCSECTTICPECGEKCSECSEGEICVDCGFCADCVGDGNFCSECALCITCVEMVCSCGNGCANCTLVCMKCGEVCANCSTEICQECGTCRDCADSEGFCISCGLCSDCGTVCPCGEGCEYCADLCPECGEVCSSCSDEFCASCDICRECADERFCEACYQCGDCTEVCEDCGVVCRDCADSICADCGKCSGCIDSFCPDCGICGECAETMCIECHYCGDCTDNLCSDCGEYCSDCTGFCEECEKCESCADLCSDCGFCRDCCAEKGAALGCGHKVCPKSAEWQQHYCSAGGHCVGSSAKMDQDENQHWTLCGEGCAIKLNEEAHLFGEGRITKEATKKAEGVMKLTCTVCGFAKEQTIPKLTGGHTHEYTAVVTAPTCSAGGYTTHTCSCGHSWTDGVTAPVKHDFQYKNTADSHWRECTFCHEADEKAEHKLSEWQTTRKPGYTFCGEKQRLCRICGYAIREELPKLTIPEDKFVVILPDYPVSGEQQHPQENDAGKEPSSPPEAAVPDAGTPEDSAISSPSAGEAASPGIKELLTKGPDNTVPALPKLPPKEEGNFFVGWVDKTTGEPVKKGDQLTGNVELEPIWKDCGEGKHTDGNADELCDECGYNLVPPVVPGESVPEDTDSSDNTTPQKEGIPSWLILLFSLFGGIVVICGGILAVVFAKRKSS